MSFSDELRNTKVISKEDIWRNFVRQAGRELCGIMENKRSVAAQQGASYVDVEINYLVHQHMDVPFPFQAKVGKLIKRDSPQYAMLKEEIGAIVSQKVEELGLHFDSIWANYYTNGNAPSDYVIGVRVSW